MEFSFYLISWAYLINHIGLEFELHWFSYITHGITTFRISHFSNLKEYNMENFVSLVVEELYGTNPSVVARAMVGHDWMQLAAIQS